MSKSVLFQASRRDVLRIAGSAGFFLAIPALSKAEQWHQRRPRFELDHIRRNGLGPQPAPDPLLDEITEALLTEYPESATQLGVDTGGRAALKSGLTDESPAGVAARAKACAERLERLKRVDMSGMRGLAAVNQAVALESHELDNEGYAFLSVFSGKPYVVSQMNGAFSWIPVFLDTLHQIETPADADAYLARTRGLC